MLCSFSHRFPFHVANFLESGRTLKRRFREETITDLLMGSLLSLGSGRVMIEFPNEPKTGADMEWDFVLEKPTRFFRLRLQAKRLYGDGKMWARHSYAELLHVSGGVLQAQTLCMAARAERATYPLYILYNPASTCILDNPASTCILANQTAPLVHGVNLLDGYRVEALVKAAATRVLRTKVKSIGHHHPHFGFLSDLFCPDMVVPMRVWNLAPGDDRPGPVMTSGISNGERTFGVPIPSDPDEIRARLVAMIARGRSAEDSPASTAELPEVPAVSETIPDDVLARIQSRLRPEFRAHTEPLNHWRVTFVSAKPPAADPALPRALR